MAAEFELYMWALISIIIVELLVAYLFVLLAPEVETSDEHENAFNKPSETLREALEEVRDRREKLK